MILGNNFGFGFDGCSCKGCGLQEEFYGCVDVIIIFKIIFFFQVQMLFFLNILRLVVIIRLIEIQLLLVIVKLIIVIIIIIIVFMIMEIVMMLLVKLVFGFGCCVINLWVGNFILDKWCIFNCVKGNCLLLVCVCL